MQVTISLLPVSLSLVHIPRTRLQALSHPILRQLLHPSPAFLNITCNDIELSLFAEHPVLDVFEPIARRDRHRQRARAGSSGSRSSAPPHEPVEISYDKWSVLQIDSHSDQIDHSGTRVHDLSAPLAAAGISILYQSSYMSDFIFVKESRLQEAMDLFESAGFHLYTSSDSTASLSPPYSPTTSDRGAVLTRCSTTTSTAAATPSPSAPPSPRHKSHSPTSGEVRILQPDLACVGLSDELGVDHWGLKIVKLVAFPDLIPAPTAPTPKRPARPSSPAASSCSSGSSSAGSEDGYFSHSPPPNASTSSLTTSVTTSRSYGDLHALASSSSAKTPSKHAVHIAPMSPISVPPRAYPYPVPPEGARGARPRPESQRQSQAQKPPTAPVRFFSFTRTPEGSSLTADVRVLAALFPPHERHMVICGGELDAADAREDGGDGGDGGDGELGEGADEYRDLEEEGRDGEDEAKSGRSRSASSGGSGSGSGNGDEDRSSGSSALKCLQIDLRRFGLDKHGLVNRFSRVLEENGINHMYSSTFKTANLLVDKRDAVRAQALLRSC